MGLPLFVYGTLKRGFKNVWARRLWTGQGAAVPARAPGRLYDLGRYPGLRRARGMNEWVYGELVEARGLLARLDRYEGAEYRRTQVRAFLGNGRWTLAWTYEYKHAVRERQRLPDGRFKRRDAPGRTSAE